ncbi:MAG: peptidase M17 [Deltaproteobacteria bacterium]|nr:peptidase M17 [Deltaproteobacteria bacterium]
MALRLEVAELTLASLDAAGADAVALFVGPERPLQGLPGLVDWRLAGALSRALRAGTYGGGAGEQLLVPTQGRLGAPRVFCFGVAEPPGDEAAYRAVAYRALDALLRAGSRSQITSLPPFGPGLAREQAARLWLEAALRFATERQVIFGEAAALRRELAAARGELSAEVELAPLAPRPRSLPGAAAVVR